MTTFNQQEPVKGAGTTLWIYSGTGDPFSNPISDTDWIRLAKVKDIQPGEMTAESFDDTYIDDEDADWTSTGQGIKSAGETSFTLAWKPGEKGQQDLVKWFSDGSVRAYRIKYLNGAVDIYRGWLSSLGKSVSSKEIITRTAKVTNNGKPVLPEDASSPVINVSGITLDKSTVSVAIGATATVNTSVLPASATNKSFTVASTDPAKAKVTANGNVLTITGVATGAAEVFALSTDGKFVAVCKVTVS